MIGAFLLSHVVTVTCPPGPEWTRERQQRPPIAEPAPVTSVRVERDDLPVVPWARSTWRLDATQRYALVCTYAEGAESVVIIDHTSRLKFAR